MGFDNVIINQANGTSGRASQNQDGFSGMIFYGTAPAVDGKWAQYATNPVLKAQQIFSAADSLACGIVPFSENTSATGSYLITAKGNTGDTINIKVTVPIANGLFKIVDLGVYTVPAGSATIALQGADIAALINAGTNQHGFSATFVTATLSITAPKNAGVSLNSGAPIGVTATGAFAGTITQFSGGTASQYAAWDYHIRQYFWKNPNGSIWVGVLATSSQFKETAELQKVSSSKLRQIGIYDIVESRASAANITNTILTANNATQSVQKTAPFICVYSPNMKSIVDMSAYPDQNFNVGRRVQTVISQDGGAEGALLFVQLGQTIGNMGVKLASIAISRVSASDAQPVVDLFNNSDGTENDVPAFSNGQIASSVSENLQAQLHDFRYTFFRKFGDTVIGTYWTSNKTCVTNSDDYAYVNDIRTMDKIQRILYGTYVPQLSAELVYNLDGTLKDYVIQMLIGLGEERVTADMITGYGNLPLIGGIRITINETQKVRATNNLVIDVIAGQNAIARNITINAGFGES